MNHLQATTSPKYCAVAIYPSGQSDPSLMMFNRRVILFDTLAIAQQVLPLLGGGRTTQWGTDGESAFWMPLDPQGVNRAVILTGYDPYRLPAGMPGHLRSETAGREWQGHLMWSHWLSDCGGNFARRDDGTFANVAAGEAVTI